jgi:6-phosphofructokinase 1
MIKGELGYKYHWAVADYLQRSARHIASQTDVDQAYALGKAAVEFALRGDNAVMPCIVRGKGSATLVHRRSGAGGHWPTREKNAA